jgi:hypothetical protein
MACGRQDDLYPLNTQSFACQELGIPVEYHEEEGFHDWFFWNTHIQQFLAANLTTSYDTMDTPQPKPPMQIPLFIDHSLQGTYFTVPFIMPEGIETLTISYSYPRHDETESQVENGVFIARKEINIIDLGLIAPDGRQVGASGSDKLSISISETRATPGYNPCKLVSGLWKIIVGAYKVAEGGVTVNYQISFTSKRLRLYMGDLHTHTFASDGVLSIEALAQHAALNGGFPCHHRAQPDDNHGYPA